MPVRAMVAAAANPTSDPTNTNAVKNKQGTQNFYLRVNNVKKLSPNKSRSDIPMAKPVTDATMTMVLHQPEKLVESEGAKGYHAALKAFSAQSDSLSWDRVALMTKLRKELNITDDEHGELLVQIR
ncbi:hypothetical protein ACLB2K_057435 [Fragaria x ananassa]